MAMTFNGIYSQVQSLCNDTNSTTLTLLKNLINQTQNNLLALRKDITETSTTTTTSASTQAYDLPYNYGKMILVTVTVGGIAYVARPLEDDDLWRQLNARGTNFTSNIPEYFYIYNNQLNLYPTPTAASNTITMYYHKVVKQMSVDDYTTGTITTLANAGTSVTGSGTTWTALFVDRFFKINNDGYWYKIESRTSNTVITLDKAFQGTAIAAGSDAYTIGEMPEIPEPYDELLVWRPTALYYQQKGELDKAGFYWGLYREMEKQFVNDRSSKVESAVIDENLAYLKKGIYTRDPNRYPLSLTS